MKILFASWCISSAIYLLQECFSYFAVRSCIFQRFKKFTAVTDLNKAIGPIFDAMVFYFQADEVTKGRRNQKGSQRLMNIHPVSIVRSVPFSWVFFYASWVPTFFSVCIRVAVVGFGFLVLRPCVLLGVMRRYRWSNCITSAPHSQGLTL